VATRSPRARSRSGRSARSASTSRCRPTRTSATTSSSSRCPRVCSAARTLSITAFAVQAYRAPEFEVKVERAAATTLVYGDTLAADVRGVYLHGAPMVGADVSATRCGAATPGSARRARRTSRSASARSRGRGGGGDDFSCSAWAVAAPDPAAACWSSRARASTDGRGVLAVSHVLQARETPWNQKGAPKAASRKKGQAAGSAVRGHVHARGAGHRSEPPGARGPPELRGPRRRGVRRRAQRPDGLQGGRAGPRRGDRDRRRRQAGQPGARSRWRWCAARPSGPRSRPGASGRTSTRPSTSRAAPARWCRTRRRSAARSPSARPAATSRAPRSPTRRAARR
jgi:hypothetical protein